jgi:hypothetical protein
MIAAAGIVGAIVYAPVRARVTQNWVVPDAARLSTDNDSVAELRPE